MSEIVKCPKCGQSFDETYENDWCTKCGEYFSDEIKKRLPKLAASLAAAPPATLSREPRSDVSVVSRYRDAYRVGGALVGVGSAIKVIGLVLAAIIGLSSMSAGRGLFGSGAVVAGIFVALIGGILLWVVGVMVAAQGRILQATLDTAVASSRFLTDAERAEAMGLPRSLADRADVRRDGA
jgi:hypothetical protein